MRGQASGDVVRLGAGRFADTRVTGTDRIFVVLAEFGRTEHPSYPDGDSDATRFNGPRHNQIPSRTAPRTTGPCGSVTTTTSTTTTCTSTG